MTALSDHYLSLICQYCVHCHKDGCSKDVPWYAVSLGCNSFEEGRPVFHCGIKASSNKSDLEGLWES
jgi:hypothetical protein